MKFKRAEDYEHLIEALKTRLAGYEKRLEDQQGMRRSLRESQDRYRTVFENSGTAIIVMARDTTITMANSGFERLTGLRKTDVQGRMRLDQIIYAADRQKMLHYQNRRSDSSEGPRMLDCHIQDDRGQIRNVLLKIDDIPGTGENVKIILIGHHQHGFETAQYFIGTPVFGQLDSRPGDIAVVLFEFGFETLEE